MGLILAEITALFAARTRRIETGLVIMDTGRFVAVKQLPEKFSIKQGGTFLREVESCWQADRPRLVLDCSNVRQLDSAGIQILLRCLEEAMKRNGDIKLASVPSAATEILELTRVDRLFEFFDSTADAVNSFRRFPVKPLQQALDSEYSTQLSPMRRESSEYRRTDSAEGFLDTEPRMGFSRRWPRWQIAGCLALLLVAPLAATGMPPGQDANTTQQVSSAAPAQPQVSDRDAMKTVADPAQPEALPNSRSTVRSQTADNSRPATVQQPSPTQQQNSTHEPVGTAAAPSLKTTGVTASRPAGAAIAPAKQRRARSILIKIGAIVGASAAVGTVVALSRASPSRPSGSR